MRHVLNDEALLQIRDGHLRRLADLFNGKHGENVFVLCGQWSTGKCDMYTEPEQWVDEALDNVATQAEALRDPLVFRSVAVSPWPFGVHFIDKLFGARVYELDGEKGNWQAEYLRTPVGELEPVDIEAHPAFAIVRRLTTAFCESGVTVPFFGAPVLSSALNIGLNLYGQELLVAMLESPKKARRDLRIITDAIVWLHQWFQRTVPFNQLQMVETCGRIQPPGHGQLCGCSTQLLSGEQYREFIAPLDAEVLGLYPGGGLIHLCGAHTHHLPVWREMKELRAVQMNDRAADDVGAYFKDLRDDQILYVNAYAGMPVEKMMDLTGGRRTVLVGNYKEPIKVRSCLQTELGRTE